MKERRKRDDVILRRCNRKSYNNNKKKKNKNTDNNKGLSMELIEEILLWLPCKEVARFKCVSRSWHELANHPKFIQLHLARSHPRFLFQSRSGGTVIYAHCEEEEEGGVSVSEFTLPSEICKSHSFVQVEGTCDGLICLRPVSRGILRLLIQNPLFMWNPTTGMVKSVSPSPSPDSRHPTWVFGFGYDSVSDDYKVLSLFTTTALALLYHDQSPSSVGNELDGPKSMMYSLKTDAWEPVESPPWDFWSARHTSGACVNSSFHWLVPDPETGLKHIKRFNLHTRKYSQIPLPDAIIDSSSAVLTVYNAGKQLCVVTNSFDIWVLKDYGNSQQSWTRLFRNKSSLTTLMSTVVSPNGLDPRCSELRLAVFQDQYGNFILLVTTPPSHHSRDTPPALWFSCNVKSQKTTKVEMPNFPPNLALAALHPWVESLLPLH